MRRLAVDGRGAVLASALAGVAPPTALALVALQAGHVNTGAFDELEAAVGFSY